MDSKFIERPKKFDNVEYKKTHYKRISVDVKPDLAERVNDYCRNNNMSKAEFIALAIETLDK